MGIWILISIFLFIIAVIIGIIVFFTFRINQKEGVKREVDYRAFFIIGISFLPLGIVLTFVVGNPGFIGFMGLGIAYIAIGLTNKDKWKKEE
jgi:flagellar basal body-associated protein FliL